MTFSITSPPLARALAERNYDSATPVQTAVLADAAAGRDLLVSAQTGSGKTVAYGIAMAQTLLGDAPVLPLSCPRPEPRSRLRSRRRASWHCRSNAS